MKDNEMVLRYCADGLMVREGVVREDGTKEESWTVEGKAIVFDAETVLWESDDEKDCEVIRRSCCEEAFMAEQDVTLNLLHDRTMTLARSDKGVGTLKLEVREDALYFVAELPKCELSRQCLELIRNGVYKGCSFEAVVKDYVVTKRENAEGKDEYLIEHTAFGRIDAVTIAMKPAYEQTKVSLRESYEELNREEAELLKRQKEEEEAKHWLAMREKEDDERRAREFVMVRAYQALSEDR